MCSLMLDLLVWYSSTSCACDNHTVSSSILTSIWDAHLNRILNNSWALLDVYSPQSLKGTEVRLSIGKRVKNTLGTHQVGHRVRFFAGFSIEHITALPDTAKDLDSGEIFTGLSSTGAPVAKHAYIQKPANSSTFSKAETKSAPLRSRRLSAPASADLKPKETSAQPTSPVLNQTHVSLYIDAVTAKAAQGHFSYNGSIFHAKLQLSSRPEMQAAAQAVQKGRALPAVIIGNPQKGVYMAKVK